MKTCTKCGMEKSLSEFSFKNKAKGRLSPVCKECHKEYNRGHYKDNPEAYKERANNNKQTLRSIINLYKKENNCLLCKESCACCLDFHHVDGSKEFNIARARHMSESRLWKEIGKCVLLCANCHRKVHAGVLVIPVSSQQGACLTMKR